MKKVNVFAIIQLIFMFAILGLDAFISLRIYDYLYPGTASVISTVSSTEDRLPSLNTDKYSAYEKNNATKVRYEETTKVDQSTYFNIRNPF